MKKEFSSLVKTLTLSFLVAGGVIVGNISMAEAATFHGGYNNSITVVTDDSSVYYPGNGTARMFLTQSYSGNSFYYLVEVNPKEGRIYILDDNGQKQLDAYGRYILLSHGDPIVRKICNYYFK